MKTAMQELIEDLQKHFENEWGHLLKEEAFKPFLEKEKEQIMKTARVCYFEGMRVSSRTTQEIINYAEEYYNQTYNQNK